MTKGPAWEELEKLGLNEHRDDPIEEAKRCLDKWTYSHSSDAEDAPEREASVTYSLVVLTLPKVLPLAEVGKSRCEQLSEFGERRGKELHKAREKEWGRWRQEADELCKDQPWLRRNKSELARRVKKRLNLLDQVSTIRKRL